MFGSMYDTQWGSVVNSFTSYNKAPANNKSAAGAWSLRPGDGVVWVPPGSTRATPTPTDDYLRPHLDLTARGTPAIAGSGSSAGRPPV